MWSIRPKTESNRVGLVLARTLVISALTIGTVGSAVACGSEDAAPVRADATSSTQAPAATSAPAPTEAPATEPTIEVTYFEVDESNNLKFLVELTNNADQAIVGLETEWIAYDADNVIVGSQRDEPPTIPAGATLRYVAGSLGRTAGTATRVEVTVVDPGKFSEDAPSPFLEVVEVKVVPDEFWGPTSFEVLATVVAPAEGINRNDVVATLIVKDAEGTITFAEGTRNLFDGPEFLPGGSKFAMRFSLTFFEGSLDDVSVEAFLSPFF